MNIPVILCHSFNTLPPLGSGSRYVVIFYVGLWDLSNSHHLPIYSLSFRWSYFKRMLELIQRMLI